MIFNVSQLMREEIGASRDFSIAEEVELPFAGHPRVRLAGALTLMRTDRGLLAQADLEGMTSEPCSRCLNEAAIPLHLSVEEEYLPTVDPVTGARLPDPPEPTPFLIDAAHHLDITEAVRQAALMAEPMKPLCRPECRGLCSSCGADLNEGPCACDRGPVDERWAALRGMGAGPGYESRRT